MLRPSIEGIGIATVGFTLYGEVASGLRPSIEGIGIAT